MPEQILNLRTFELADLLQQIEILPDVIVFARGEVPFTGKTLCVLVFDEHGDDVIDQLFSLGFYEGLEVSIIKIAKRIAYDELERVTDEHLIKAFNFYLIYDGFCLFDNG